MSIVEATGGSHLNNSFMSSQAESIQDFLFLFSLFDVSFQILFAIIIYQKIHRICNLGELMSLKETLTSVILLRLEPFVLHT